jgi:hypothetical protein
MLHAVTPPPGESVLINNTDHDELTAGLRAAEADLDTAQETHRVIPTRLPLGEINPGQQVLDIQTKLITHAIRIAAFNTATTLARAVRVHTSYARASHESTRPHPASPHRQRRHRPPRRSPDRPVGPPTNPARDHSDRRAV